MQKRLSVLFMLLIFSLSLSAASMTGGIPVREGLFYSEEELDSFDFSQKITEGERAYYENTHIYITSIAPSDPVYIYFGHAGIEVETPGRESVMFDYGTFRFDKSFYFNFALGRLYYNVIESYTAYRYRQFIDEDRTIKRIELDLTPEEKKAMIAFLSYNILPENDTYLYNYYRDNCATRPRDIYNKATDDRFRNWAENIDTGKSFRAWSTPYMHKSFFFAFILNYLQGPNVDYPVNLYDACFLPDVLLDAVEAFEGHDAEVIYQSETRPETPEEYGIYLKSAATGLVLSMVILLTALRIKGLRIAVDVLSAMMYIFLGILSIVLLFMMTMTNHDVTYGNANILIISPFVLIQAFLHLSSIGKKEKRRALGYTSSIMLYAVVLYLVIKGCFMDYLYQDNIAYILFIIPIYSAEIIVYQLRKDSRTAKTLHRI